MDCNLKNIMPKRRYSSKMMKSFFCVLFLVLYCCQLSRCEVTMTDDFLDTLTLTTESSSPTTTTTTTTSFVTTTEITTTTMETTISTDETPRETKKLECGSPHIQFDQDRVISLPRTGNVTWGNAALKKCFSEFVVFYQHDENKRKSVLCPNYKVVFDDDDFRFSCFANFSSNLCGKTLRISMEAWSVSEDLFEPSLQVRVDCSIKENTTVSLTYDDDDDEINFPESNPISKSSITTNNNINNNNIHCRWSEWTRWSSCSVTCGNSPGIKTRSRSQRGSRLCGDTQNERKKCHVNRCPQDCQWGSWSDWSPCSVTCGTRGTAIRKRKIIVPHLFGGRPCSGDVTDSKTCSGGLCSVNGEWSEWTHWGYCRTKCGLGSRTRTRSCDNPVPENGGKSCLTTIDNDDVTRKSQEELILRRNPRIEGGIQMEEESQECKLKDCEPVDGLWSTWSRWSTCSVTCGRGRIVRTRKCDSPSPAHGGTPCSGEDSQYRPCFLRRCVNGIEITTNVSGNHWRANLFTTASSFTASSPSSSSSSSSVPSTFLPPFRSNLIASRLNFVNELRNNNNNNNNDNDDENNNNNYDNYNNDGEIYSKKEKSSLSVDITELLFHRAVGTCINKTPYVHGFLGPFVKDGIRLSRDRKFLRVGETAFYLCNHGKVVDPITNRRGFFVVCKESNEYLTPLLVHSTNYSVENVGYSKWPNCVTPFYCLEPAPIFVGYSLPEPRQHASVNTPIYYTCLNNPNISYSASCFPDGKYRVPIHPPVNCYGIVDYDNYDDNDRHDQDEDVEEDKEEEEEEEDDAKNRLKFRRINAAFKTGFKSDQRSLSIEVNDPDLSKKYGWIESSVEYPEDYITCETSPCAISISIESMGYDFRLGIEDFVVFDIDPSLRVEILVDSRQRRRRKIEAVIGHTFLAKENVTLSLMTSQYPQRWKFRFNFQVVAP